ncbi:60 kDa chaperonin [compost metagenome]
MAHCGFPTVHSGLLAAALHAGGDNVASGRESNAPQTRPQPPQTQRQCSCSDRGAVPEDTGRQPWHPPPRSPSNNLRGALKICAVKSPGFGDSRTGQLGDLAALTGATVVSPQAGISLEHVTLEPLGEARDESRSRENTLQACGRRFAGRPFLRIGADTRLPGRTCANNRKKGSRRPEARWPTPPLSSPP